MKVKSNIATSDSGFIFNPNTGESFSLNPIGNKILEWMRNKKSHEEIISLVQNEYSIDTDTIEKDLKDFTESLKQYQVLEEKTI